MQGTVLQFDTNSKQGIISSENKRFEFLFKDWKSKEEPKVGAIVDFILNEENVSEIYAIGTNNTNQVIEKAPFKAKNTSSVALAIIVAISLFLPFKSNYTLMDLDGIIILPLILLGAVFLFFGIQKWLTTITILIPIGIIAYNIYENIKLIKMFNQNPFDFLGYGSYIVIIASILLVSSLIINIEDNTFNKKSN